MSDALQAAAMRLFSPEGRANPYPIYATLREAGAVSGPMRPTSRTLPELDPGNQIRIRWFDCGW